LLLNENVDSDSEKEENQGENPEENQGENPEENQGENLEENQGENQEENPEENQYKIYVPFKTEQFKTNQECCPCESDNEDEIILSEDDIDDEEERLREEEKELNQQVEAIDIMSNMLVPLSKTTEFVNNNENIVEPGKMITSLSEQDNYKQESAI
jgi:hypothetical protein